jgi:hypothetical protein
MYIATQLPSQYRYGQPDIDFKGLLTEGNVVEGQYFILDGEIEASYSKTYLYKKAEEEDQLFCVKHNNGKIKYTDSTDLEWSGSAENTIKYLTKDRPLPGASQTQSHNIEGFYKTSGTPIDQMQDWLIFKDETNPSALFSTEFPCITVADFSPDTFKNDQKKDEEIAFIDFLSSWDHVQSLSLAFNGKLHLNMSDEGVIKGTFCSEEEVSQKLSKKIEQKCIKRFFQFLERISSGKIYALKMPGIDCNVIYVWAHARGGSGTKYHFQSSQHVLDNFFQSLRRFNSLREIDFENALHPLREESWFGSCIEHKELINTKLLDLLNLLNGLNKLKIDYPTYFMIKDNPELVRRMKNLKLHLYQTARDETLKETIRNTLSGGQGEVIFENDLPPSSGCVIS